MPAWKTKVWMQDWSMHKCSVRSQGLVPVERPLQGQGRCIWVGHNLVPDKALPLALAAPHGVGKQPAK